VAPKEILVSAGNASFNPSLTMNRVTRAVVKPCLRVSLKGSPSVQSFDFKPSINNEEDVKSPLSKQSGETVDQSMTFSSANEEHKFLESSTFGKKKEGSNFIFKSAGKPNALLNSRKWPLQSQQSNSQNLLISSKQPPILKSAPKAFDPINDE
jgi:hypothetical protein